jgi:methyl-accepting chemotaxis protein
MFGAFRFSVGIRFWVSLAISLCLLLAIAALSIDRVNTIGADLGEINEVNSVKQRYAINFRGSVHDRAIAIRDVVLVSSDKELEDAIALIARLAATYAENETKMAGMVSGPAGASDEEKAILTEIADVQAKTNPLVAKIIDLRHAGDMKAANALLLGEARPNFVAWLRAINKFIDYQEKLNHTVGTGVIKITSSFQLYALIASGLALLISLITGTLVVRSITSPLRELRASLQKMSEGELDIQIAHVQKNDEIGDLARAVVGVKDAVQAEAGIRAEAETRMRDAEHAKETQLSDERSRQAEETSRAVRELSQALEEMAAGNLDFRINESFSGSLDELRTNFNISVEKLQSALISFSENAATIQTGSQEIRSAAENLARRTEQQAASVEQTAAALEEITTSVKDSTRRAEEAGALVGRTKSGAEKSGEVVRDAVQAMSAIEQSSQSISNIIGVIDEIAFQTNLLALNAGVEAARAGEAGKGFAVVAQEVRELAQRSAQAAKEIKSLITSSGEQVKRGVNLVGQTGNALETIVSEVQQINSNVEAIVQAAREQSTGLQEINTAVNQMDQSTQQNAAMVEESNAASHTLVAEVTSLSARLGQFNLGSGVNAARASAQSSARASTSQPARVPVARSAAPDARPSPSPARALGNKVASAFGGAKTAASGGDWQEF